VKKLQISGVVKSVRYTNEKNGYTVCEVEVEKELVTMVGIMPLLKAGEYISAEGRYVTHMTYGRQFMVEICEIAKPSKEEEMIDYLSSGFIKGLGPATARNIVETFRDKTYEIFEKEPYRLSEVKGISPQKALLFGQAFIEHENIRQIVMLLAKFNISSRYAARVWRKFGIFAGAEIQKNPYVLAESDIGISFEECDKIAQYYGIEPYHKERLKSAVLYLLNKFRANGNTYAIKADLIEQVAKLANVSREFILDAFDALLLEGRICIEKRFPDRVYTDYLIEAERYCARKLCLLNEDFHDFDADETDELIEEYEKNNDIYLDELQKTAIKSALNKGVCVITGGPGTGKTTIIKTLISIFKSRGLDVALTAPTGRAAKRVSEATGWEAKTIHRLLEVGYRIEEDEEPYFMHHEDNPLTYDVIIVDEASMIDIVIMSSLLRAIPDGTRLILVGDADQLQSVGPGKVLSDIIESGRFPVVKLTTIFRQSEQSLIVTNAHRINQGLMPYISKEEGDFFFIPKMTSQETAKAVVELCARTIPQKFGFDPVRDIQVLSPMRKGYTGVSRLNEILQEILNPRQNKPQKVFGSTVFRAGDRVMQIRNDYTMTYVTTDEKGGWSEGIGVYNGDLGFITDIDSKNEIITVTFDDNRTCEYNPDQLDNLEHAYAITVHKSQGSEFPAVVIPLFAVPPVLMCRNLLYTAVTRAKKLVVIVGSFEIMEKMIGNTNERERFSGLRERLCEYSGA